jgi:hypothetical protein
MLMYICFLVQVCNDNESAVLLSCWLVQVCNDTCTIMIYVLLPCWLLSCWLAGCLCNSVGCFWSFGGDVECWMVEAAGGWSARWLKLKLLECWSCWMLLAFWNMQVDECFSLLVDICCWLIAYACGILECHEICCTLECHVIYFWLIYAAGW